MSATQSSDLLLQGDLSAQNAELRGQIIVHGPTLVSFLLVDRPFYTEGELTPPVLAANQDNYHPPGLENTTVLFLVASVPVTITSISFIATPVGVQPPAVIQNANGRNLWVYNGGGQTITLQHLAPPPAQPENRIIGYGNANVALTAARCAHLYHSLAAGNVWVQIGQ